MRRGMRSGVDMMGPRTKRARMGSAQEYAFGGNVRKGLNKAARIGHQMYEAMRPAMDYMMPEVKRVGKKALKAGLPYMEQMARDVFEHGSAGDYAKAKGAMKQGMRGAAGAGYREARGELPAMARYAGKGIGLKRGGRASKRNMEDYVDEYRFGGFVKGIGEGFKKAGRGAYKLGKDVYEGTRGDLENIGKHAWEASKGDLKRIAKGALARGLSGDYKGAAKYAAGEMPDVGSKVFKGVKGDLPGLGEHAFGSARKSLGLKRGGSVRKRRGPMVGERPGKNAGFNYESQMQGQKCVAKAGKGARCYAAGGSAKVRHGQANRRGMQVAPRVYVNRGE
jgi:hypothetical protein